MERGRIRETDQAKDGDRRIEKGGRGRERKRDIS